MSYDFFLTLPKARGNQAGHAPADRVSRALAILRQQEPGIVIVAGTGRPGVAASLLT